MTEEQKDILMMKMIDSPCSLSEDEIRAIMNDEELRDIYETSSGLSGAYAGSKEIDVAAEWALFRHRLHRKPSAWNWVMRVAAIFLGVAFLSGITAKLIDHIFDRGEAPEYAVALEVEPEIGIAEPEMECGAQVIESAPSPIKMDAGVPSGSMARAGSGVKEMDAEEYLRIQQARIDNEIAMMTARLYEERYQMLLMDEDCEDEEIEFLENVIPTVTSL